MAYTVLVGQLPIILHVSQSRYSAHIYLNLVSSLHAISPTPGRYQLLFALICHLSDHEAFYVTCQESEKSSRSEVMQGSLRG